MSNTQAIQKIITEKDNFPPCINYIRFPYFRNLQPDTRIDFEYPFTVFVGQNGCGKSSVLQALYGAPDKFSLGDYWFTTVIDPIAEPDVEEHRHCFIYSHSNQGGNCEVLKRRIFKEGKPDLWDTSEAMARYRMSSPGKRTASPIKKEVIFVNFRTAQNAFEKVFHEERPPVAGVQGLLRQRSGYLAKGLSGKFADGRFLNNSCYKPIAFTKEQLSAVKEILGREYTEATIIKHRLFGIMGHSVFMKTAGAQYSEAFAGSGEFAIFLLVHEVTRASQGSLLLLDEPETSLHPGAQRNLQRYLLEQCVRKKLQIILCSHSPALIEGLPTGWVKVFWQGENGKFNVLNRALSSEAFHFIGEPQRNKRVIHVEDKLAKKIVSAVARELKPNISLPFEVVYSPGGDSQLRQDAVVYSREDPTRDFIIFDKDVEPSNLFADPGEIPQSVFGDSDAAVSHLQQMLDATKYTGVKFALNSNPQPFLKRDVMVKYINYVRKSVFYFPEDLERMIWNEDLAERMHKDDPSPTMSFDSLKKLDKMKYRYVELARPGAEDPSMPTATEIDFIHNIFMRDWISRNDENLEKIKEILGGFY